MEKQGSVAGRLFAGQVTPSSNDQPPVGTTSILLAIPDLRRLSLDELTALIALRRRYQWHTPDRADR